MKTQLSTVVSPETRQAYNRLVKSTGVSLTDLLTAAVPLLERHFQRAEMVAGYVQLDRWGDLDASSHCPECDQPFGDLPWIAVRGNGVTDPPVCSRCATSEARQISDNITHIDRLNVALSDQEKINRALRRAGFAGTWLYSY